MDAGNAARIPYFASTRTEISGAPTTARFEPAEFALSTGFKCRSFLPPMVQGIRESNEGRILMVMLSSILCSFAEG